MSEQYSAIKDEFNAYSPKAQTARLEIPFGASRLRDTIMTFGNKI